MPETADVSPIDPRALRDCCGRFATGVTVVTTRTPEGDHGMTVSAFMSVSLDPPLVCIALDKRSRMLPKVRVSGRYAVNILTESMREHALHFAGRSRETMKDLFEERGALPVLRGAEAILVADVVQEVEAGDHVLLVGHVNHLESALVTSPLLYHAGQFGRVGRPSP